MNQPTSLPVIAVSAGILYRPDGAILLASRPVGKPWSGYWEFPGGKIEAGETSRQALTRELEEELGIQVTHATPWLTLTHNYPTARIGLNCFLIDTWQGDPMPREGQMLSWQHPDAVNVMPLLPANLPLLRALCLPPIIGITHIENDPAGFLEKLDAALLAGLKLIQLREAGLTQHYAETVIARAHQHGAQVVINQDVNLAQRTRADGIHLTAKQLADTATRPDFRLVGASCHNKPELDQAEQLGCDYALLSPVLPTASHPGVAVLGWEGFAELVRGCSLPVYALGGMTQSLLTPARERGAHGIALLRGIWS
ncbi:MAG: Nudix family hydrolase [Betaproteobacteria bacterium]|nr:Nudix family hydrolase [Betaproteobacteria bacterium]